MGLGRHSLGQKRSSLPRKPTSGLPPTTHKSTASARLQVAFGSGFQLLGQRAKGAEIAEAKVSLSRKRSGENSWALLRAPTYRADNRLLAQTQLCRAEGG